MTNNAKHAKHWHLPRAFMLVFLLLFTAVGVATAVAQENVPASESAEDYERLADALANDKVRAELVEQLRRLANEEGGVAVEGAQAPEALIVPADDELDLPNAEKSGLVTRLQTFAESLRNDIVQSWYVLRAFASGDAASREHLLVWRAVLLNLLLSVLATFIAYAIFRWMASPVFRRFDVWAKRLPTKSELAEQQAELVRRAEQREQQVAALREQQVQNQAELAAGGGEFSHIHSEQVTKQQRVEDEVLTGGTAVDPRQAEKNYMQRYTKLRKLAAVAGAFLVDVGTIFLAAVVGYLVTAALPAQEENSSLLAIQFLTAFVGVELVRSLSRGVFSTRYAQLRLLAIEDSSAVFWNRWVNNVVAVSGYGLLVLVPVLQTVLSPALANVAGAALIVVVYIYAVSVLWRHRVSVTNTLLKQAEHAVSTFSGTVLRIIARMWVWVAIAYFTVLLVVTQIDQQNALLFMATATAQTLAALLLGGVLSLLLSSLAAHRVHLSARWNNAFPLLEERLNSYVPAVLKSIRLLVVFSVLLSVFDAWQVLDLRAWFFSSGGQAALQTAVRVVVVLLIAALLWTVLASIIEHRLALSGSKMPTEREKTLLMLFRNALAVVIITLTVLIVLAQVGIDIGPLIAGAGVVGLAVGFGAQKLVQDVITGVFIQLENGMNQNDVVEVAGLFGVVEKLTIRSVVIRTLDGGYHLIPFSSIDCVANHTRDYGYHYGEYCIALRESVDEAIHYLHVAFEDLKKDPEVMNEILEDISIPGVTSLNREGFTIRVLIKTTPGMQWAVQRSFNRLVKIHFDAAGIELPYPQTVVHFGRDKNGYAAPADLRMVDAVAQSQRVEGQVVPAPGQSYRPVPSPLFPNANSSS